MMRSLTPCRGATRISWTVTDSRRAGAGASLEESCGLWGRPMTEMEKELDTARPGTLASRWNVTKAAWTNSPDTDGMQCPEPI